MKIVLLIVFGLLVFSNAQETSEEDTNDYVQLYQSTRAVVIWRNIQCGQENDFCESVVDGDERIQRVCRASIAVYVCEGITDPEAFEKAVKQKIQAKA